MFSHLTGERIAAIRSFLVTANIAYDSELRSLLLNGVNSQYVSQLRNYKNDSYQLSGDLLALNALERLADGTIPFEVWLRNAVEELSFRDTANILSRALNELANRKSITAAIAQPTIMPDLAQVREKIIHRDDMVAYAFLVAGSEAGKSVAQVQVPRHDNGSLTLTPAGETQLHQGTGWLLTPNHLITNHHVINARMDDEGEASFEDLRLQAANTTVQFDYDGQTTNSNSVLATELLAFDSNLDFAILRLARPVAHAALRVNLKRIDVKQDSYIAVNIIQHPNGGPKKVALRNNLVYDSNFPRLRYFTDTQHGSSGSPVFNDAWQVVALHRASTFVDNVDFQGRSTGWVNEGTQMAAIVDFVKQQDQHLYSAIMDPAQP